MRKKGKKLISIVLTFSLMFLSITFWQNHKILADDTYETVGDGNGWQCMTTNDGSYITYEGGSSWEDYPTFTIWNGPQHPMYSGVSPYGSTAGRYVMMVNAWNRIGNFFKSPVYTVQNSGTHTVTLKTEHNLNYYNTATRYSCMLLDTSENILYNATKENKVREDDPDDTDNTYNYFGLYVNGDEQEVSFDVDLEAGEEVQIYYARNNGGRLIVTEAYISEPEPETTDYHVSLDGNIIEGISENDTYTLPTQARYGYLLDGELYRGGNEFTVDRNLNFTSVNQVSVTMSGGASIKLAAPAGLGYEAQVNAPEALLNSNAITAGMLITFADLFTEQGYGALDENSTYLKAAIISDGFMENNPGAYRIGVYGIDTGNYERDFIARAYVQLIYQDGTKSDVIYSGYSDEKNIRQVATSILENGKDEEKTEFVRQCAGVS